MEQVLSECSGARVLVKSGPAKPKLEGLSKAQWSLANLTIFNKLVTEGELDEQGMLDHMSHTAYMYCCQKIRHPSSSMTGNTGVNSLSISSGGAHMHRT